MSAGNTAIFIFPLCVLFVFLALAAQYESWSLPLAVILIVPMCLLSAMAGVYFRGQDNNIFTQIGFIVLVGLACKNAILIVEFARQQMESRERAHRGGSRGGTATFAADSHDLFCLYSWRVTVSARQRRRGGNGPGFGDRGLRRNDRGDFLWFGFYSSVFLGDQQKLSAQTKATAREVHSSQDTDGRAGALNGKRNLTGGRSLARRARKA